MTDRAPFQLLETDLDGLEARAGRIAVLMGTDGALSPSARRIDSKMKGALKRLADSKSFEKMKEGDATTLSFPQGLEAEAVIVAKLDPKADRDAARKAGASIAASRGDAALLVLAHALKQGEDLALGLMLRDYEFKARKSDQGEPRPEMILMHSRPETVDLTRAGALADGIFLTRDLVNEPANVLTTTDFASRIEAMSDDGLKIEIIEEDRLRELGMNLLLSVGQGSAAPSKVGVIRWENGGDAKPLVLVGKGVVFDTGGISLKPAQGMEDMTMDMGGAGTVVGVMKALAGRKAKANVVGLVGLVENMPSGTATRPGDVVTSMKGDTVEIINTDAEGRLVLADVMWYAQDRFEPAAMIDLATLTGAIIIGLGHEKAGIFANDDDLAGAFLKAAETEGEGAWRMPLGKAYDDQLKSRIADMKNVGGRPAGSITAAQFLQRFVKDDTPWMHIDIAGVASRSDGTVLAPKGASGWGVLALDRLIADRFEA
ncbi:leucyl aminopeptidase [Aestuariibius sp. 2305UL40-4]|uniref:leucyl aminopeptidase n=1 Tax=Aestuariibius violaceus TaxID=3234132 RepID=UPI00345E40DF